MQETKRKRWPALLFFIVLGVATAACVYGGLSFPSGNPPLVSDQAQTLSSGWYYFKETGQRIDLPALPTIVTELEARQLTIYHALPSTLPEDAALGLDNYHQTIEVFVKQQPVYSYGPADNAPVGRILGSIRHFVPLPSGAQGQPLALRLTAPNSPGNFHISDIVLGSRSALLQSFWQSITGIAAFVLFFGALGIAFSAFSLLLKVKRINFNRQGFFDLGLFLLLSTVWIFTDSKLPQLLPVDLTVLYLLSFLSFMLMPVPFLLFLRQLSVHGRKLLDALSLLFLLNCVLSAALYLTGVADFVATLPITHGLMLAAMVSALTICLREQIHYRNYETRFVLVGICALVLGGLASLLSFAPNGGRDNSLFYRCGLIVFLLLLCYGSMKRGFTLLRSSVEAESYRSLAFTDTMTRLSNRAAFDRDAEAFGKHDSDSMLSVTVFDINNLKYVNDTYGHLAGDRLIQDAAKCVQESFQGLGACYRIGGDEFAAILPGITEKQVKTALLRFEELTAQYGAAHPEGLEVPSGYACAMAAGTDCVYQLFRRADAMMYKKKGAKVREKHPLN